tara:strand:+ start:191 stop:361 length:171 start_codon:yes stop_codon:yes gene_type:complete
VDISLKREHDEVWVPVNVQESFYGYEEKGTSQKFGYARIYSHGAGRRDYHPTFNGT